MDGKNLCYDSIINIAVGMIVKPFKNTVNSLVVDIIMPLIIGFAKPMFMIYL